MTNAEKFQAWKAAHYPTASRVDTQKMYAAWVAATDWHAPKPAPDRPKPSPPKSSKKKSAKRSGSPGDE